MVSEPVKYSKPLPGVDEDTKPFFDYCKQHELRVQKCLQCNQLFYPPSYMCPHCQHLNSEWVQLSGKGQVYSYVIVRRASHPGFAKEVPYVVAIIEMAEGPRMTSNVIGCNPEDDMIGMLVEVFFEDITEEFSLPKFKPVSE